MSSRKREPFPDDDLKRRTTAPYDELEDEIREKEEYLAKLDANRGKKPSPIEEPKKMPEPPAKEPQKGIVSTFPTPLKMGDEVTIAGNDFTINGITYYGKGLDNDNHDPIDSRIYQTKIGEFDVEVQGVFQARRIIAFQNVIATNPLETISYLRVKFDGRAAVLSEVSLFFVGPPANLDAYQRDRSNRIVPITIDKGTISQDSGAVNKLAYVLYGDSEKPNIEKARALVGDLSDTSRVDVITDTSKTSAELEAEKFMRDKLREWGVTFPATLSGKALEDLYTAEHQKRAGQKMKRGIQPNPQVQLQMPSIAHPILPETGFRKYGSKILLVTLVGAGVIMYQRSIANR